MRTTRLAPSPTGALHLGNARTFLINWLLARCNGWSIVLRIEDLDGPRTKRGADRQLIQDLQWLGLDFDDGPVYQSARRQRYQQAIDALIAEGFAYPCVCSRKDVESAASAPHREDAAGIYPGTCRGKYDSPAAGQHATGKTPAIRFRVPDQAIEFDDGFAGDQRFEVARQVGDFVIAKADGTPAYQLAVAIDDADMGVTDIVRGDDLLDSTARQLLLYRALKVPDRIPKYYHFPLVVGPDGRRLAKRHGDTRLAYYREQGVAPQRVLGLLAQWCGIGDLTWTSGPRDMIPRFRLDRLSRHPIVLTSEDHRWLLEGARWT